ncbi:MAG: hypothetical protein ACLPXB_17615 [Thiobacillaceae bacterium]
MDQRKQYDGKYRYQACAHGRPEMIPPTGKPFKRTMATIGHGKGSAVDEEYLFSDSQTFTEQIGLARGRAFQPAAETRA